MPLNMMRTAVLLAAAAGRTRPTRLHVGCPGGPTLSLDHDPAWDHGLRTDAVGAMLRAAGDPPWVWLSRPGGTTVEDADAAWLAATLAAAAERQVEVSFVVVTRHGWVDPRSGVGQRWRRLRRH